MPNLFDLALAFFLLSTAVGCVLASAIMLVALSDGRDRSEAPRLPLPRSALRTLRDDHRSRHPRGVPVGLRGAEPWL